MDEQPFQLNANNIQSKYKLPKIAAKRIQQANLFINEPKQAIKRIMGESNNRSLSENKLKLDISGIKARKKMNRVTTVEYNNENSQRQIINLKMKKFRPVNGSFSEFYGQKLILNGNRTKSTTEKLYAEYIKQLNSPLKDPLLKDTKIKESMWHIQNSFSSELTHYPADKNQQSYISKLKTIRQTSQLLRQNSKSLSRKAQSVLTFNNQRFQKLRDDSIHMLDGSQKYIFDEEFSKTYRINALQSKIKFRSKK